MYMNVLMYFWWIPYVYIVKYWFSIGIGWNIGKLHFNNIRHFCKVLYIVDIYLYILRNGNMQKWAIITIAMVWSQNKWRCKALVNILYGWLNNEEDNIMNIVHYTKIYASLGHLSTIKWVFYWFFFKWGNMNELGIFSLEKKWGQGI